MKILELNQAKPLKIITLSGFYERHTTKVLQKVRDGFERHFDAAGSGQPGALSAEWLTERLHVINLILDKRQDAASH